MGFDLGNFPVLAVQTTEIAARGGQGKSLYARFKMKERFFFDGIGVDRTRIAVSQAVEFAVHVDSGSTDAAVSGSQKTEIGTYFTDDLAVIQLFIRAAFPGTFP